MAVLGASRAFKDWQVGNGVAPESSENGEEAAVETPPAKNAGEEVVQDFSDSELQTLENQDPLSLIDSISTRVGSLKTSSTAARKSILSQRQSALTFSEPVFKIDDYLPDAWKPQYAIYKKQLLEVLVRTGVITQPASPEDSADRPGKFALRCARPDTDHCVHNAELARARTAHNAIVDELKEAQKTLDSANQSLAKDWGRDWEWKKLDGTCVEKDLGE